MAQKYEIALISVAQRRPKSEQDHLLGSGSLIFVGFSKQ